MNLKRLRGIYAVALITIAAALFAGCSNSMAGSVDSGRGMVTLQLSATGIPEEYAKEFAAYCEKQQRAASRSILPDDPFDIGGIGAGDGKQSDELVLVLTGKSETGMTYGPEVVTLNTGVTVDGKTVYDFNETVAMDAMSWNLVLTAYSDAAKTKPVLVGYCSVDLRNGSGTATFVMGIAGLTTPGTVSIEGTIVDTDDAATSYTMGIYRKDNNQDVNGTETKVENFKASSSNTFSFNANNKDVPPGTYLYTMIFYNDVNEIIGSFTDTIVINPGNALKKENLVIDVIGKMPTEPEDLKAYLMNGSESSDGRTYNVKVTWTQADYATNYELNVVESANDGTDFTTAAPTLLAGGQVYGMASMDKGATKTVLDFPSSPVFGGTASSSMMYGDESCVLKLETGKVYEIQLRARNYIGVSDWVDREAGGTETNCTAYDAPSNQRINRLLITYNTDSGTLKVGETGKSYTTKYAEYKCWTTNADLLKIDDVDEPASGQIALKKGGASFVAWLLEDGSAIKDVSGTETETSTRGDAVEKYTYKNVSVIASFGNKVSGAISQEGKLQDIDMDDITVEYGSAIISTPLSANAAGIYNLAKMDNGVSNKIQVSLDGVGTKYANAKLEVWGQSNSTHKSVSPSSPGVYQIDTATYPAGKMYVMVTADTENATSMSQTLIFDLK